MSEFEQILGMIDSCTRTTSLDTITHIDTATKEITTLITIGICITIVLGVAILLNQRKIKKMLRELKEQKKEEET